jgi:glycosyltransferase involved in cell wall biosynthesis
MAQSDHVANQNSLSTVDVDVCAGDTYEIILRWSGAQAATPRFALAAPRFYDSNGKVVPPPPNLKISEAVGAYRYFKPIADRRGGGSSASASVTAPAHAVRMFVDILPWASQGEFGTVEADVANLSGPQFISECGTLPIPIDDQEITLFGEISVSGALRRNVGIIEVMFCNSDLEPILFLAKGCETSESFINYFSIKQYKKDDIVKLEFKFHPPADAQHMIWRLRPAEDFSLYISKSFELRREQVSTDAVLDALPTSARLSLYTDEKKYRILRSTLSQEPLWPRVANRDLTLLGEVIVGTLPDGWISLSGNITVHRSILPSNRIIIHPIYLDNGFFPIQSKFNHAIASIPVPKDAVRMRADILRWSARGNFGDVTATVRRQDSGEYMAVNVITTNDKKNGREVLTAFTMLVSEGGRYDIILRWQGDQPIIPRLALVTPYFYDVHGKEVPPEGLFISGAVGPYCYFKASAEGDSDMASLPGHATLANVGPVRYASAEGLKRGEIVFQEAFLTPANAASAAFYVAALDGQMDATITALSAIGVKPDAIHENLRTSNLDLAQINQQMQIANRTRDLPAQRMLAAALSAYHPTDPRAAHRARALTDNMTELSPDWSPPLPAQPVYAQDPSVILHLFKTIYPDENTGGAIRSKAIVETQAARGLHPVACMPLNAFHAGAKPLQEDGLYEVERNGARVYYSHYPGLNRKQIGAATLLSLETALANRVLQSRKAGMIHASSGFRGYENALKGLTLARTNNLPWVYEVRSFHEHTWRPLEALHYGDRMTKLRTLQENRCMMAADAVVTISQAMAQILLERGVPENRLFVVPNAIDPVFETFPVQDDIFRLRQQHGILGKTTVGYISNFSEREGHRVLLDAFTRLIANGHELHLVMVGDGPVRPKMLEEVRKRGLESRTVMPGNIDHSNIRAWYHMIDLFVVPRIADFASDHVTPLKPFEAMSQGVPMIISERPVTAEIAGNASERAAVFPAGDPVALAGLIEAELADRTRLLERAEAARSWVMSERVWSNVIKNYDHIYEAARHVHSERTQTRG